MSYTSINILPDDVRLNDVHVLIDLLGYRYQDAQHDGEIGRINNYYWYEEKDFKSTSGVSLSTFYKESRIYIETSTPISRSYYDLEQQNRTIKLLRKFFGGKFETDQGKGRYLNVGGGRPDPTAAGCQQAFDRFGTNLIRATQYLNSRNFENEKTSGLNFVDLFNPGLLSNNFILTFLTSICEDYWKSTYIALLKYSDNKEKILKTGKISAYSLMQISNGEKSVEEGFAESISFSMISNVCTHFKALDHRIDFSGVLMKPYHRRRSNLFDSLEEMRVVRNKIVHDAGRPTLLEEEYVKESIVILHESIERCYKELIKLNSWTFHKTWRAL